MSQINQIKNPCEACTYFKRTHPMVQYRNGFKGLCLNNETSYVSNWNILYILNTLLKDTNKKYKKKGVEK